MKQKISVYRNVLDTIGIQVSVRAVIQKIRSGSRNLDIRTKRLRELQKNDTEKYQKSKLSLPGATFSGNFRKRRRTELITHSGLICLDFDHIDARDVKSQLMQNPAVLAAFISPSGEGVKAIFRIDPIPTDAREHKLAWTAIKESLSDLSEIDESAKDVSRLCFLCYDPDIYVNPDAIPVKYEITEEIIVDKTAEVERRKKKTARSEKIRTELRARGVELMEMSDPLPEWMQISPEKLLTEIGCQHLHGNSWHWPESGPGRSFELSGSILKPFSNSIQAHSPNSDPHTPVNAHRFIAWYLYSLDMTKGSDKRKLRVKLAELGYGTPPDVFYETRRKEWQAAIEAGLLDTPKRRWGLTKRTGKKPESWQRNERVFVKGTQNGWEKQEPRRVNLS